MSRRSSPIPEPAELDAAHDRRAALAASRLAAARLRFLYPGNRKVLAYLREFDGERILCVANVSRAPQAVELDLSEFAGAAPVEMTAGSPFPIIGTAPYVLTLSAYGFIWFRLETVKAERQRRNRSRSCSRWSPRARSKRSLRVAN